MLINNVTARWTEVLAHVEQALAESVAKIDQRARDLANALPGASVPLPDFDQIATTIGKLDSCSAGVGQGVAQLDTALQEPEEGLRQWLLRAEAARRQLATWAGRAIG
jgi:hypothetical protein